jgi:hypothetical protein
MPELLPHVPAPGCGHCGEPPAVQWQRRPTGPELAGIVAAEVQRREAARQGAAERGEDPYVYGPLPTADTTTLAVLACRDHAISLDDAARVHAADCPAPHPQHLPACGCSPEELPPPVPLHTQQPTVTLPSGWTLPA